MLRVRSASFLFLAILGFSPWVQAESAIDVRPTMAAEGSSIKPARERKLVGVERPTVKKRAAREAAEDRSRRISLQIPERLRKALAARIDSRISWNIGQSKKLRQEALKLLEAFVRETPPKSPDLPEALLRLGELEWEQARDDFLLKFQRWDRSPADSRGEPPSPDYSRARGRFLRVLKHHKTFPEYDLALYVDGFLANEEGKFSEALSRFNKILSWFPNSRFVPDAHMMRAEYEFTKAAPNYRVAYREYEKVLAYKDTELYDIALFKSAWTLWRLGRREEAARRFLAVFRQTSEGGSGQRKRSRAEIDELQREALKNLVAVFVEDEQNSAEDMYRFLKRAGGAKFAGKIVEALAEAFYDQAHYERGIEAYRLLLKLQPTSAHGYEYALKVAQGHSTMEAWRPLAEDYRWIIREYVPKPKHQAKGGTQSAWVASQPEKVRARARAATEAQLRSDAVGLHAKAQADDSESEFKAAALLYGVYLERFAEADAAYEVYFNLGEIHFYRLKDANRAADNYLAAVKKNPKGKLSRGALYNALAALEVARAAEFEVDKKKHRTPKETPTDKKLTRAMELYVESYPEDKQVPELLFRQGKLYYDYGVYDPAVRQWGLLVEKYPRSSYAAGAGELILDSFNKSEDYENIETWARRLKKAPAFQSSAQKAKLDQLIIGAVFKQGEQHAKQGHHKKAAAAYLRAAKEFPKEPRAAQAAVNAEVSARRAADLKTLTQAAELLVRDHQHRKEAAQGLWIAANTYQELGLFSKAADYHALVVNGWPKFEHHKAAAYNAVLLRTTVGEHEKAIESGEKFNKYYRRDPDADEVMFLMGKAHEKAGEVEDARRLYDRYARRAKDPNSRIEALVRLASVQKEGSRERARALDRAMKVYQQRRSKLDARGRYHAAKARYMQGERALAEYEAVKIEGSVKQLKARLRQKSELLKKAASAFLETAEMGVAEWTTAALYQIGFAYESFAQALLNSPPPKNLSPEEQELYLQAIDEFVIPIEERGLEAYESGWMKAVELGIFNQWTAKMRAALGRLNSELYPPLKEIGFRLRSKSPLPFPELIEAPRRSEKGHSQSFLIRAAAKTTSGAAPRKSADKADSKPADTKDGSKPPAKTSSTESEASP